MSGKFRHLPELWSSYWKAHLEHNLEGLYDGGTQFFSLDKMSITETGVLLMSLVKGHATEGVEWLQEWC